MTHQHKLALFIAGFATLTLEVVLMRVVTKFLGEGALATTTTLSLFLLGLSLPPLWFARVGFKHHRFFVCGVFALLALLCLPLYIATPTNTGWDLLIASLLIFLPALVSGLILPLFANFASYKSTLIYALFNTGAALGAGTTGLYLLPQLGLKRTILTLSALFIFCALQTLRTDNGSKALENEEVQEKAGANFILVFAAVTSALCLLCESVMIRLVTALVGSSVTGLALVAATYVGGLSLGNCLAVLNKPLIQNKNIFSWLALLVVLDLTALSLSLPYLPELYLHWRGSVAGTAIPLLPSILICITVCLPLATIFGFVFPACNKQSGANHFAKLLGVSTAASVVAPWIYFAALTYQIPTVCDSVILGLLRLCLVISAALSLIYTPRDSAKSRFKSGLSALPGTLVLLSFLSSPPEQKQALTTGPIFLPEHQSWQKLLTYERQNHKLQFYADGLLDTVGLFEDKQRNEQILLSSGKIEAVKSSVANSAQFTHILLALLPQAISNYHPDVLVIGMGLSITADTFCQLPVNKVTVIEIEKQIVNANNIAAKLWISKPITSKLKPQIIWADARRQLAQCDTKYDIISCQPSEPWVNGSGSLFTEEFLKLSKSRLKPDGVFAQWLQLYGLDQSNFLAYIKLFSETYSDCLVFHQKGSGEIILLGRNTIASASEQSQSVQTIAAHLKAPFNMLWKQAGIDNQEQLNDSIFTAEQVRSLLAQNSALTGTKRSTDDNLALQYQAYLPDYGTNVTEDTIRSNILLLDRQKQPYTRHLNPIKY